MPAYVETELVKLYSLNLSFIGSLSSQALFNDDKSRHNLSEG